MSVLAGPKIILTFPVKDAMAAGGVFCHGRMEDNKIWPSARRYGHHGGFVVGYIAGKYYLLTWLRPLLFAR